MTEDASCIPDRLVRFNDTAQAMADGLYRRVGPLTDALSAYVAACDPQYVVDCRDSTAAVSEWRGDFRAFGTWTADVGRAFEAADENGGYVTDYLPEMWADDPFLGVPEAAPGEEDPIGGDQDGPPQWLETLQEGGDLAGISSELIKGYAELLTALPESVTVTVRVVNGSVEVLSDGAVVARYTEMELTARLITPTAGPGLTAAGKWLGRAGNILGFVTGFAEQYVGDEGLPPGERLLRATTKGIGVGGGAMAGAAGGATLGLGCGPVAPVCSPVLAIGGGIAGAILGDELTDLLPWMDEPEPGEYDLEAVEDAIADPGDGDGPGDEVLASVDLLASDVALAETDDDPALQAALEQILPPRDELMDIIEPPQPQPTSAPPTGTTTPIPDAVPAEPQPGPPPPTPTPTPTTPTATPTTTPSGG